MAELLGIKTSTYSQMERKGVITAEAIKRLAEILEVDAYFLLYGVEQKEKPQTENEEFKRVKEREEKYRMEFGFLSSVSAVELKHLQEIHFRLTRAQRTKIYEYEYKILTKKLSINEI